MKRTKLWALLCGVLFAVGAACCLWILRPSTQSTVEITQDGTLLYQLDLAHTEDQIIEVEYEGRSNLIQIENGDIFVWQAQCPDQTCVHMGRLSANVLPIVCLPNRLVIQYAEPGMDGATG